MTDEKKICGECPIIRQAARSYVINISAKSFDRRATTIDQVKKGPTEHPLIEVGNVENFQISSGWDLTPKQIVIPTDRLDPFYNFVKVLCGN